MKQIEKSSVRQLSRVLKKSDSKTIVCTRPKFDNDLKNYFYYTEVEKYYRSK